MPVSVFTPHWTCQRCHGRLERSRVRWANVSATASAAINEVREIAYNLAPYQLDRLGLAETVLDMVDRMASASAIVFKTEMGDIDGRLSKEAEISVFRIVQESVNNIVKHSGAAEASVTITAGEEGMTVQVVDNGRGFNAATVDDEATTPGFGLNGLLERARMLHGTCLIEPGAGSGTRVTIMIPL